MGSPVAARAVELAQLLTDAGLRTTLDHRTLNPPCVWIGAPTLVVESFCSYGADWPIYAVAQNAGDLESLEILAPMIDAIGEVLPIERAEPTTLATANGGDPLPAYRLTYREGI